MPIYEYHCQQCGKDHEIIQKFSDAPLTICPACGGALQKQMSLSGFQLKGGGWYKDGYSSPTPPKKEEKKTETKSEVKKAESKSVETKK